MPDRECSAEERHLRELVVMMFEERDKQYQQRYKELRQLLDERNTLYAQQFDAQKTAVLTALTTSKEAVAKAEVASEKRFESLNEFRGTLRDQQSTFVTRVEYLSNHETLEDRVNDLARAIEKTSGRAEGSKTVIAYIVAAASALVALLLYLVERKGG